MIIISYLIHFTAQRALRILSIIIFFPLAHKISATPDFSRNGDADAGSRRYVHANHRCTRIRSRPEIRGLLISYLTFTLSIFLLSLSDLHLFSLLSPPSCFSFLIFIFSLSSVTLLTSYYNYLCFFSF